MEKINTVELLWESPAKNHEGKPFFTVKQSRAYYTYGERVGKDSIALILESKPPLDTETELISMTTAFGGSIDMGNKVTYEEICQTEVREESGFRVDLKNIHSIGKTLVSTQMSQLCYGFLVDVTNIKKTEIAEYETSDNEFKGNAVKWLTKDEVMENNDWKSIWIMTKSLYKENKTYFVDRIDSEFESSYDILETVYENGELLIETTLDEIRELSN